MGDAQVMYADDGTYHIGLNPAFVARVKAKRGEEARVERKRRKEERDRAREARQEAMTVPIAEIVRGFARKHRIKPTDITSRNRSKVARFARAEAIRSVYRAMPDMPISVIAKNFGVNRTTVIRYMRDASRDEGVEIPILHSGMLPREIALSVAKYHGVGADVIFGDRTDAIAVRARYDAIHCIHKLKPNLSSGYLGKMFNRCHTTILYALGTLSNKSKRRTGHHPVYESL